MKSHTLRLATLDSVEPLIPSSSPSSPLSSSPSPHNSFETMRNLRKRAVVAAIVSDEDSDEEEPDLDPEDEEIEDAGGGEDHEADDIDEDGDEEGYVEVEDGDVDQTMNVDANEEEEAGDDAAAEDEDIEVDEVDDDEDEEPPPPRSPPKSRAKGGQTQKPSQPLKIKLKLPAHPSTASTSAAATPVPEDVSPSKYSKRGRDIDIESEDEDDDDDARVGRSARPMTTRQAVLASVVDSTHVSLDEGSRKKKPLNESELALRREETARKRKNLSEKKLEDEKAETINRLLKKQSRAKTKRNALSSTVPPTDSNTPVNPGSPSGLQDDELMVDEDQVETGSAAQSQQPAEPVMYRWISSTRSRSTPAGVSEKPDPERKGKEKADPGDGNSENMWITFSVPFVALPPAPEDHSMDVDQENKPGGLGHKPPRCDAPGCTKPRKYRWVKDWQRGACGMECLGVLQRTAVS